MAITLWFLSRVGCLEAANAYDRNPHHYRRHVLTKSPEYLGWLTNCDPKTLAWLRVIRDPYQRCVSSFRHMLRHGNERDVMSRIGISIVEQGLSFWEFLGFLGSLDIEFCDVHYRQQYHPLEQHVTPQKIVNLDKDGSLLMALEEFEQEIGLPPLDPQRRGRMHGGMEAERKRHHTGRERASIAGADRRIRRQDAGGAWPDYSTFLIPEARRMIEQIYASDFAAYEAHL